MSYVAVIALLGLVICIHELGHFLAAKAVGLPVARFSLGLGPVVASRRFGRTRYCLSAIPFGGYVLLDLAGESDYLRLPLWRRLVFSLAGPAANILFALACYMVLYALTPETAHVPGGFLTRPAAWVLGNVQAILSAIPRLWQHGENVSSLVGIVAEGGRFVGRSLSRFFLLGGYLSVSLAIFNLLPLPPLDGGKMLFDTLERCWGRLSRFYAPSSVCGGLTLLALMLYATVQDVWHYLA